MKLKVLAIVMFGFVLIIGLYMWLLPGSSSNDKLMRDEIKAYFRPTIHLDYNPDMNDIKEIMIGGAISMSYDSVKSVYIFEQVEHIEQITDCLNSLKLVNAFDGELPNMSPDSFIQYYDSKGERVKNFLIYGTIFIKDVDNKKIYRIKNTNSDIVDQLETLKFY